MPYLKCGVWYLSVPDGAGTKRVRSDARTKTEAKNLEAELKLQRQRQRLGLQALPGSHAFTTIAELVRWWLAEFGVNEPVVLSVTKHIVESSFGATRLEHLRRAHVEDFLRAKEAELGPRTLNGLRGHLHNAFNRAIETERFTGTNPIAGVRRRKVPKRAPNYLNAHEVPAVLAALPTKWRPLFATALYAGLRKGEAMALHKNSIDLERRLLMVERSHDRDTTKGGRAEAVPIADELLPYLEEAKRTSTSHLLFPSEDGEQLSRTTKLEIILRRALARAGIVEAFEHVCRRQGCGFSERHASAELRRCPACAMKLWPRAIVRPLRFHDLRHTTATQLLRAGAPIAAVQRIMRHTDPRITTEVYGHLSPDFLQGQINRLRFTATPPLPPVESSASTGERAGENHRLFREEEVSGREDSNLRPLRPESRHLGSHTLSSVSSVAQSLDISQPQQSLASHPLAENHPQPATRPLPRTVGEVLTVREVAAELKVSTATVYALATEGKLEHFRVCNVIRVTRVALEAFKHGRTGGAQ